MKPENDETEEDYETGWDSKEIRNIDETRMKKKYWTPKRRATQDWSHLVTFTCNVCNLGNYLSLYSM